MNFYKPHLFILVSFLFSTIISSNAQSGFISHGSIQYVRKSNAFRLTEGSWLGQFFKKGDFQTDTFQLDFDSIQSLYFNPSFDPDAEEENSGGWSLRVSPSKSNIVYKNHQSDTLWAMRDLFEKRIIIHDSFRNIAWKITGETRDIAGFACHKAVGILYDSMYIVAFYTDQILTKSGPETFANLPGMIMEIAIPRLFTTWKAISFNPAKPIIKKPNLPKKKKDIYSWTTYYPDLTQRFSDWGNLFKTLMVWMWGA